MILRKRRYLIVILIIFTFNIGGSNATQQKMVNGIWIERLKIVPKEYINSGNKIGSTGLYLKIEKINDVYNIWHLAGSEITLFKYKKIKCIEMLCSFEEPEKKYFINKEGSNLFLKFIEDDIFIVIKPKNLRISSEGKTFFVKHNDESKIDHVDDISISLLKDSNELMKIVGEN